QALFLNKKRLKPLSVNTFRFNQRLKPLSVNTFRFNQQALITSLFDRLFCIIPNFEFIFEKNLSPF
uniref:hypothetical protein n=1 Tax=Okeania hirsuta TaxID=1458930 RepID=UPI001961620B